VVSQLVDSRLQEVIAGSCIISTSFMVIISCTASMVIISCTAYMVIISCAA
jgi:hypothetical protein